MGSGRGLRGLIAVLALSVLVAGAPVASARTPLEPRPPVAPTAGTAAKFVPGEVLVAFRPGVGAGARKAALARRGARAVQLLGGGPARVRLPPGASVEAAADALERDPSVLYAEPNYLYRLAAEPDDPRYLAADLWGLARIDAPGAWELQTGDPADVVVAVVDSGVDATHPDLVDNLVAGKDFVDEDDDPDDEHGHGTHVAGTIGARGNNAAGIAGVNWAVSITPIRAADADGLVAGADVVQSFEHACANGADVVNASFGGPSSSTAILNTIKSSACAGTLFVAAAGNGGSDGVGDSNDANPQYPCNYASANVVCVGATTKSDKLARFSNFGLKSVDLVAPGVKILSASRDEVLFHDSFEDAAVFAAEWTPGAFAGVSQWARTDERKDVGAFSLADSPGGSYANGSETWIETTNPVDLTGGTSCTADYAVRFQFGSGDGLLVEARAGAGSWDVLGGGAWVGSTNGAFIDVADDLSAYDGAASVYLRFSVIADASGVGDGAHLDDLVVRCYTGAHGGADYVKLEGTSMATPHVAGVAALVAAENPALTPAQVRARLLASVDPLAALAKKIVTGGRLNAARAVAAANDLTAPALAVNAPAKIRLGRALKKGIKTSVTCDERCRVVSQLVIPSKLAKKLKIRTLVGTAKKDLAAPGTVAVTTKFTKKAKRKLSKLNRFKVTVRTKSTDDAGNATTVKRAVRVRR